MILSAFAFQIIYFHTEAHVILLYSHDYNKSHNKFTV